jgi:hypothetical protein
MDGNIPLNEVDMVMLNTEKAIKSIMLSMHVVLVVPHAQNKSNKT